MAKGAKLQNAPSKTGNPSGKGRSNNVPKSSGQGNKSVATPGKGNNISKSPGSKKS